MSRASITNNGAGVVDEKAVQAWLRVPDAGARGSVDVPLCLTVLEMLLDAVDTSVFVVAADGQVVVANARGMLLLERHGEVLRSFLYAGMREPSVADPNVASWSEGPFCGKRRWFSLGGRGGHALVFVEEAESSRR